MWIETFPQDGPAVVDGRQHADIGCEAAVSTGFNAGCNDA
jgi:hypothetical protein